MVCWGPSNVGSLPLPCPAAAGDMGSGPALALLLLAAIGTLHCCSPAAAADGGAPSLGAAGITFGQSARRLLEAFDATAGALDCDTSTYVAPLTINTPGLYRFRVKALGTNTNSASEWHTWQCAKCGVRGHGHLLHNSNSQALLPLLLPAKPQAQNAP